MKKLFEFEFLKKLTKPISKVTLPMSTDPKNSPDAIPYGQLPPESEQLKIVAQANEKIQGYAFLMNRQFDEGKYEDGLRYATKMLDEMKTNLLSPIHYNELYNNVMSELSSHLSFYFQDTTIFSSESVAKLYETIQYTPAIVPRLYLLFTLAPAFIKAGHARACDVMRDLITMVRGVQHPTRALFLRYYLLQIMKDVLPDGNNTSGGTLEDTLAFILENFKQMNVLWVRLEFSLDTKSADDRKEQRIQLKQLVGSNIQRISMLHGLDVAHYKEIVMPSLIEQITQCREPIAQNYIIEIMTQVFPADFHIETLCELFHVLEQLEDEVQTLQLVTVIITRLQDYVTEEGYDPTMAINTVRLIATQIDQLLKHGGNFSLEDTLKMLSTLLNFTLKADAANTANVNSILCFVENHILSIYGEKRLDTESVSLHLRKFLTTPLQQMSDASMIFDLEFFPVLVDRMLYLDRRQIALEVCKGFSRTEAIINNTDNLHSFFTIIQVLLQRPKDWVAGPDGEQQQYSDLQAVARVFHLIRDPRDLDATFALLVSVSTTIQKLDSNVKEALYLSLGEAILRVAVDISLEPDGSSTTVRNVLQHIYALLSPQADPPVAPAFWLYLESTKISDRCGTDAITTEFFVSAFRLWKDGGLDSSVRYRMLLSMIRTATELRNLEGTSYESITTELCSSANTLLAKEQQAEAHLFCAHLFNVKRERNGNEGNEEEDEEEAFLNPDKIKNCLVRALKAITAMMDPIAQLPWFYKVLSAATFFIESGVQLPSAWYGALTYKIDQMHQELQRDIETRLQPEHKTFYRNLINHKNQVIHLVEQ